MAGEVAAYQVFVPFRAGTEGYTGFRIPAIAATAVGLLYETGDFSPYTTVTFRRIPVEELS